MITCRKCSHEWNPDPLKWRNNALHSTEQHFLKCPRCSNWNKIGTDQIERIIETSDFHVGSKELATPSNLNGSDVSSTKASKDQAASATKSPGHGQDILRQLISPQQ